MFSINSDVRLRGYLIRSRQDFKIEMLLIKDDLLHSLGQHKEILLLLSGLLDGREQYTLSIVAVKKIVTPKP